MASLIEKYADKIRGVLSCFDHVVIKNTLPGICYADGTTTFLNINKIRIFDYPHFAILSFQLSAYFTQVLIHGYQHSSIVSPPFH